MPVALRRAALDTAGACAVAGATLVVVGHVFPNFDVFYALIWGHDVAQGRTPDYFAPDAPAPHPLANTVATLLSPLGRATSVDVVRLAGPLALGALCVALFRLGATLYAWPVGLVAAAIMGTRVPTLLLSGRSFIDVPAAALIVWAAVLEASRPRRRVAVLVLLALAGLLRAEAWLLSLAYLLWIAPNYRWPERVRLAALAAAGPVLWLSSNLLVTGSPVEPSHGARITIPETILGYPNPNSRTGLLAVPDAATRDLGNWLQPVPLALAVGGLVAGAIWLRRQTVVPGAVAALNTAGFVVLALTGLSIEQRYLAPTVTMIALFAAVAVSGWLALPSGRVRRRWTFIGACGIAALLSSLVVFDLRRIDDARSTLAAENRLQSDLEDLVDQPVARSALARARLVVLPNPRVLPELAFWTERPPTAFSTDLAASTRPSALITARSTAAQRYVATASPPTGVIAAAGYRQTATTPSWILWQRG